VWRRLASRRSAFASSLRRPLNLPAKIEKSSRVSGTATSGFHRRDSAMTTPRKDGKLCSRIESWADEMSWRIVGRSVEGEPFLIDGLNIWESKWEGMTSDTVEVFDPTYRETYRLHRYQIRQADRILVFAAGETSANVWMFCVEQ
jgi:hypothetical protein